jgi:hypothetical protein
MTSPAFAAHAATALEAIYATFGVAATWTPAAGGTPIPCTIVKRSPDDTVSLGPVRDAAQLATNLVAVRTSEVAARPAKGDVVAITAATASGSSAARRPTTSGCSGSAKPRRSRPGPMRYSYKAPDQRKVYGQQEAEIARAGTAAMGDAARGMKDELRELTRAAGLGSRLANTWQRQDLSRPARQPGSRGLRVEQGPADHGRLHAGASIYADRRPRYLAIPTENVPRKGRGKRMTPLDVEVAFNQDLIIRPAAGLTAGLRRRRLRRASRKARARLRQAPPGARWASRSWC